MAPEIVAIGPDELARYASVPMRILVESVLELDPVRDSGSGLGLSERRLPKPYTKDYDAHGGPESWPERFELPEWHIVLAVDGGDVLGAAATTPGFTGDPPSKAILWDIRVHPQAQGKGIGRALLDDAKTWAAEKGFRRLRVETQNVNVRACRFYHSQGGVLTATDPAAYLGQAGLEDEFAIYFEFGGLLTGARRAP